MRNSTQLMTLAFVALLTLALVTAGCVTLNPSSVANPAPSNTSASTTAVSRGMVTYQNTSWGVKFSYPEEWFVGVLLNRQETGNYFLIQPFYDPMLGCQMVFSRYNKSPYESSNNTVAALNYVNRSIANSKNSPFTTYKEGVPISNSTPSTNYTVVQEPTLFTLAGVPAWKYIASYNYPSDAERPTRTFMTIVTTHENYFYAISYGGPPEDYNRYLGTAQQIIDSFEFT